jgi:hypothetical protein
MTDRPPSPLASAAPPTAARFLAFTAIVVGGVCGGLIGYALVDLSCDGDCGLAEGLGGLIGAVLAALGVAVVAVLVLRAMGEWQTVRRRDADTVAIRGNGSQRAKTNRRKPSA